MAQQVRNQLSKQEHGKVKALLNGGLQPVRTVLRALALIQLANGEPTIKDSGQPWAVAESSMANRSAFSAGRDRRALYDRTRPGAAGLLDAQEQQRIVALACSQPQGIGEG